MTRWVLMTVTGLWISVAPLSADNAAPAGAERGVFAPQQPADEPLTPIDPVRSRTPGEEKQLDALAHFMAAELYLERGEDELVPKALRELEQAIELNPSEIDPYRLYIPAAVRLQDDERARKYALLATEKTEEGVQLLRALVAVYVQQGQVKSAIAALEQSQQLDGLGPQSFARLILNRHLGQCYDLDEQPEP
ncbi:MAG: hypothetical protein KDA75_12435, partial [Planctomycetaceae bacterium]|nr:hypothetical protein [Planctomycetaceae bacterium]